MKLIGLQNRCDKLTQAMRSVRLAKALCIHRVLAGAEHRRVLDTQLATVVDIGANRGQFALAVRQWAPQADLIAFEPLPGPASVFRSVFANDDRVVLHEAAIGPQLSRCKMHVSARDDSSSLLPISSLQSKIFPGTAEVSTIDVQVAPLDTFVSLEELHEPSLLKLDVQGFELEALQGCESLLCGFGSIYCECSFVELYSGQRLASDVIEWLAVRGFRINGLYNPSYDSEGRSVQADILFSRAI